MVEDWVLNLYETTKCYNHCIYQHTHTHTHTETTKCYNHCIHHGHCPCLTMTSVTNSSPRYGFHTKFAGSPEQAWFTVTSCSAPSVAPPRRCSILFWVHGRRLPRGATGLKKEWLETPLVPSSANSTTHNDDIWRERHLYVVRLLTSSSIIKCRVCELSASTTCYGEKKREKIQLFVFRPRNVYMWEVGSLKRWKLKGFVFVFFFLCPKQEKTLPPRSVLLTSQIENGEHPHQDCSIVHKT